MRLSLRAAALLLPLLSPAYSQTWTIGNPDIQRTITFSDAKGLTTERLTDLVTHTDFIEPGKPPKYTSAEFSLQCNGKTYFGSGKAFRLVSGTLAPIPGGKSLTVVLSAKEIPLEVSVIYREYEGHPAIRKHLVLRNSGTAPLHLSHLNIEAIAPSVGPENQTTLLTQYGTIPREIFYTGRSEDAGLLVANALSGVGFGIVSEVPGYMKRTEIAGWEDASHVRVGVLYDTDLMPFERSLEPGETFETAAVSFVSFQNGNGFRDPHWVLPGYTAKVLMRRVDKQGGAPWIYNTWEPFQRTINQETVFHLIEAASVMGMDIFTIDDGWQQEYGSNEVNMQAFPGGLKPIQDALEAKGMRLGLWIPLAAIGTATPDYINHPEWAALDQNGKPKITGTAAGPKAVMCLASPFREAAARRVNDAIEQFHLAYVKLDLTTIFNAYGESPGCWAKGHRHGDWAESLNLIYEGISYVTAKVYEKHPDVLLDLTFELWGQKHVIDAGLLAAGDLDWLSNVNDREPGAAGPLQARTLLYQRAASMPVESMLIGNLHGESPDIAERFATAIGSAPVLVGDLTKLSPADRQWFHEKIGWFKKLRKEYKISESFFPLGQWLQPNAANWDGFARLDHNGNGVIVVFRNESKTATADVHLPLLPAGKFRLHSVMTNTDTGVFSQRRWSDGVPIPFPAAGRVNVLEIRPEAQ